MVDVLIGPARHRSSNLLGDGYDLLGYEGQAVPPEPPLPHVETATTALPVGSRTGALTHITPERLLLGVTGRATRARPHQLSGGWTSIAGFSSTRRALTKDVVDLLPRQVGEHHRAQRSAPRRTTSSGSDWMPNSIVGRTITATSETVNVAEWARSRPGRGSTAPLIPGPVWVVPWISSPREVGDVVGGQSSTGGVRIRHSDRARAAGARRQLCARRIRRPTPLPIGNRLVRGDY